MWKFVIINVSFPQQLRFSGAAIKNKRHLSVDPRLLQLGSTHRDYHEKSATTICCLNASKDQKQKMNISERSPRWRKQLQTYKYVKIINPLP